MYPVLIEYKTGCKARGKKIKDLAIELDADYTYLNRVLNGFLKPTEGFGRFCITIDNVFKKWDRESGKIATIGGNHAHEKTAAAQVRA